MPDRRRPTHLGLGLYPCPSSVRKPLWHVDHAEGREGLAEAANELQVGLLGLRPALRLTAQERWQPQAEGACGAGRLAEGPAEGVAPLPRTRPDRCREVRRHHELRVRPGRCRRLHEGPDVGTEVAVQHQLGEYRRHQEPVLPATAQGLERILPARPIVAGQEARPAQLLRRGGQGIPHGLRCTLHLDGRGPEEQREDADPPPAPRQGLGRGVHRRQRAVPGMEGKRPGVLQEDLRHIRGHREHQVSDEHRLERAQVEDNLCEGAGVQVLPDWPQDAKVKALMGPILGDGQVLWIGGQHAQAVGGKTQQLKRQRDWH
mmetsp:Transcript_21817/g.60549  ORF Transcript_21817/g.60549 Transcript_21817/m.60549 type:complete len:317 (-) Transcript_21817:299-1249(-)